MKSKFLILFMLCVIGSIQSNWAQCEKDYRVLKLYFRQCPDLENSSTRITDLKNESIYSTKRSLNKFEASVKGMIGFCIPDGIKSGIQIDIKIDSDKYYYPENGGTYKYNVSANKLDSREICLKKRISFNNSRSADKDFDNAVKNFIDISNHKTSTNTKGNKKVNESSLYEQIIEKYKKQLIKIYQQPQYIPRNEIDYILREIEDIVLKMKTIESTRKMAKAIQVIDMNEKAYFDQRVPQIFFFSSRSIYVRKENIHILKLFNKMIDERLDSVKRLHPSRDITVEIEVEGYSDTQSIPFNSGLYDLICPPCVNKELKQVLSEKRAEALLSAMAYRVKHSLVRVRVITRGRGQKKPFIDVQYAPDHQKGVYSGNDPQRRICKLSVLIKIEVYK